MSNTEREDVGMKRTKEYTNTISRMRSFLEKDRKDPKKKLRDILPRVERLADMYFEVSEYNKDAIDNILNACGTYKISAVGDSEGYRIVGIKRCSYDGTKEYTLAIARSQGEVYAHFGSYNKIHRRDEFSFFLGRKTWVINGHDVLDSELKNDRKTRGKIDATVECFVKEFNRYEQQIYKKIGVIA